MINTRIIADSVNDYDKRITTYVLTYPRFIHCELLTHRVMTRNSASSRAISIEKMIEAVEKDIAWPVFWGKNQKGMQSTGELSFEEINCVKSIWEASRDSQIKFVKQLSKAGLHKQLANRLLEAYAHITTLLTATDFGNFFNLRAHKDAQPEFQELAFQMLEAYQASTPVFKKVGDWHLPFADKYIEDGLSIHELLKITTARAARVSYNNFEGDISYEKDFVLHDRLAESGHWSPFEHPAKNMDNDKYYGNFQGWLQYRKTFPNENNRIFNPTQLLVNRRGKKNEKNSDVVQVEKSV